MHGITNLLPYTVLDLALGDQDNEVFWLLSSSSGMVGHVQQGIIVCQLFEHSHIPDINKYHGQWLNFHTFTPGARSLVGHKYDKWSLVALSLTTPQINTAESQSLAYNLDYFCRILIELNG